MANSWGPWIERKHSVNFVPFVESGMLATDHCLLPDRTLIEPLCCDIRESQFRGQNETPLPFQVLGKKVNVILYGYLWKRQLRVPTSFVRDGRLKVQISLSSNKQISSFYVNITWPRGVLYGVLVGMTPIAQIIKSVPTYSDIGYIPKWNISIRNVLFLTVYRFLLFTSRIQVQCNIYNRHFSF